MEPPPFRGVMGRILSHRLVRTLLGALVALTMGLPAVQAGEMALKMAAPAGAVGPALGGCTGCAGMDKSMDSEVCLQLCPAPVSGLVPTGRTLAAGHGSTPTLAENWSMAGRTIAPDPAPPRPHEIG